VIPPARPGGRPRNTDMRAAMNTILYLLRTGCPWRYLPRHGFPPRSTVYNILRKRHRNLQMNALCRHAEPASCQLGCALLCDCDVTLGLASDKLNLKITNRTGESCHDRRAPALD
jgi:Putative transposase of IS4/5 family (DUF4096)